MPRDVLKEVLELKAKHKGRNKRASFPDLTCREEAHPLSNNIHVSGGYKRNKREDHKWRRDSGESAETVKAIEEKAARIRPHFNKGGYQFSTDGDNKGEIRIYRK